MGPDVQRKPPVDRRAICVLLVDDQRFVGIALERLLKGEQDVQLHCCYHAVDAIVQANEINPTIILQDLVLPDIDGLTMVRLFRANPATADTPVIVLSGNDNMDGVEATRQIMASAPCAIVIVTGSVHVNAARVFEAMGYGALDVVDMPASGTGNLPERTAPLLAKIATVSRLIGGTDPMRRAPAAGHGTPGSVRNHPLIAIGASAGGPAALAAVLRGLPRDFPAAIVVVQHVEARFAGGMADWLSQQSALPVMVAKEGECPVVGKVLLAGTSDHLALTAANRLGYTPDPRDSVHRPSVDVFFESVGQLWRGDAVGVLLTGMGSDGARGLKALRSRGYHTIAQDRATSAVYGMPKAAAALKAAVEILPMDRIASRLVDVVTRKG
jgi:two-component system response regulator WspF